MRPGAEWRPQPPRSWGRFFDLKGVLCAKTTDDPDPAAQPPTEKKNQPIRRGCFEALECVIGVYPHESVQ
jgi:hypothetical protein